MAGAPAAARTVPVELGTAINDGAFSWGDGPYRTTFTANFDAATHEHSMKMIATQPERGRFDFSMADAITDWARRNGKKVHGHTLLWCRDEWTPAWVTNRSWTRTELLAVMAEHIRTTVARYRGRVATWDVVNEGIDRYGKQEPCVWQRYIGADWIEEAFRIAHAADPEAKLFYNEYAAETVNAKFLGMEAMAKDLLARGVPLHGIGLQHHTYGYQPVQDRIEEAMARIGALGLAVHVSEFDVPTFLIAGTTEEKLSQQAQAYQTVAAACQAQPACFRFTTWGHVDGIGWRPASEMALPFDASYQPKAAWRAMQRVLRPPPEPAKNRAPSTPGRPVPGAPVATRDLAISWSPSTDADKNPVTYTLQHRDADDADWSTVASGIRTTSYAFTSSRLERQGTWTYRVLADDGYVQSAWSAASDAAKVDRSAPYAPTVAATRAAEHVDGGILWFRDKVTVAFTDNGDQRLPDGSEGSGVDPATVPEPFTFAAAGSHDATGTVVDRAGNRSASRTRSFSVDTTDPVLTRTATADGVPYAGAWTREDVGIAYACTDSGAGVASAPADAVVTTEGAGQRRTGECRDAVGHVVTVSTDVNIDRTPPTAPLVGADRTAEDAEDGWFRDRVTATFAAAGDAFADGTPGSGVDPASVPAARTFTAEGTHTAAGSVRDRAGNVSPLGTRTVRVDVSAPRASASAATADGRPYLAGTWTRAAVTVTFACADDASGVVAAPAPAHLDREGASLEAAATCTDRVGHTASAGFRQIRIDRTPPAAPTLQTDRAPEDAAGGWFAEAVTVRAAAGDDPALPGGEPGSGVDPASVPAARTLETSGTVTARVADLAGNTSPPAERTVRIDRVPPDVTLTCPASVVQGDEAAARWQAADEHSGLATAASGSVPLDTATAGSRTARTQARDRVGRTAAASCAYTVAARPEAGDGASAPAPQPTPEPAPQPDAPVADEETAAPREQAPAAPADTSDAPAPAPVGDAAPSSATTAAAGTDPPTDGAASAAGATSIATSTPSLGASDAPVPVRVRTATVRVTRTGWVAIRLACAGSARGGCGLVLQLRDGRARAAEARAVRMAAGRSATARLRLTEQTRRRLRRRGELRLTLAAGPRRDRLATVRVLARR